MDVIPGQQSSLNERMSLLWQRGVRLATRLAIAFGLSTLTAIGLGAAVTDNAFVQILVTVFAAFAFWLPFLFLVVRVDRYLAHRRSRRSRRSVRAEAAPHSIDPPEESWRRLHAVAPDHSERLAVLHRSLGRTRLELGKADLDPDAHDLCVLIDRRLPELIHRELDALPPDDNHRRRQVGELVDLIEQFARHCSRSRNDDSSSASFEAAVLRRRFEARLTDF